MKKQIIVKKKRAPVKGPFVCYALEHTHTKKSYTGQTNNIERRLRQHNGEIKGGARYTSLAKAKGKIKKGSWKLLFKVCGFQTIRSVLQFEIAMKKRKVPTRFKPNVKKYTRGPSGRVRQLEYLLSLGRLNKEPHSVFATNGIYVEVHMPRERYMQYSNFDINQFEHARQSQGVPFYFLGL